MFRYISEWWERRGLSIGIYIKKVPEGRLFWGLNQNSKISLADCCRSYPRKRFGYLVPEQEWYQVRETLSHLYGQVIVGDGFLGGRRIKFFDFDA